MTEVSELPKAGVGPTTWVFVKDDLKNLLSAIQTAQEIVVDLETTGLEEHAYRGGLANGGVAARIVLATFTLPQDNEKDPTTWILPLSHPKSPFTAKWLGVMTIVAQRMLKSKKPIVNQNMKFDARWIYALTGVDLSAQIAWDTQIASHLLDETSSTSLKDRAPKVFQVQRWDDDIDLTYPGAAEDIDIFKLGEYAARDTYWVWKLKNQQRAEMFLSGQEQPIGQDDTQNARLGKIAMKVSMPTIRSLTRMEQNGIRLDIDWTREQLREHEQEADSRKEQIAGYYSGLDPEKVSLAPTSKWFKSFTELAVEKGDLKITAMTPSGAPQWNKDVLRRQSREGNDLARILLEQRDHAKKAEFLRSWLTHVSKAGYIHTSYRAASVLTGRLSSSSPNMQQVTHALRPAFIPSPGNVIIDLDYSQIEMRVAAYISRCAPMIQAFRDGEDLHRIIAAQIVNIQNPHAKISMEEVDADGRQKGKAANFGLIYGMGAYGFQTYADSAYDVQLTEEEALLIHRAYFDTWVGLDTWHNQMISKVRQVGFVTSPIGRVRRLPEVWDGNDTLASRAERQAINSPVQGFASDLLQISAALIQGFIDGYEPIPKVKAIGTVHDSIMLEAPEDSWESATAQALEYMESTVLDVLETLDCSFDVPLKVEASVGTRWGWDDVSNPS